MYKLFKIIILGVMLSGCAKYPITKVNILTQAVQYSVQTIKEPEKSKEMVIEEVLKELKNYFNDPIVNVKIKEKVSNQYDVIYDRVISDENYVSKSIEEIFSNPNDILVNQYWHPKARIKVNSSFNKNRLEANIKYIIDNTSWTIGSGNSYYTSNALVDFNLKGEVSNKVGQYLINISSLGYLIDCTSRNGSKEVVDIITVNDNKLKELMLKYKTNPTDMVFELTKYAKNILDTRYVYTNSDKYKIEKTYLTDFATAKARLQRSLGAFKYDNEKSAFVFEKTYHKNAYNTPFTLKHRFIISLFPERNHTVVEFSGDYNYITDTFTGSNFFGKNEYNKEMDSYFALVNSVLLK